MKTRTPKFQARMDQLVRGLRHGPMTFDDLSKTLGFDPTNQLKALLKEERIRVRKEALGINGNFGRNVYFVDEASEPIKEDLNGFSDALRVMMGYAPMRQINIVGHTFIFDEEEYHELHKDEIRNQAPAIGAMKFGSMQSSFGELEVYGAA